MPCGDFIKSKIVGLNRRATCNNLGQWNGEQESTTPLSRSIGNILALSRLYECMYLCTYVI